MSNKIIIKEHISEERLQTYLEEDKIKEALNYDPPKAWVKKHPYISNHKYVPIDKIEFLLDKIFKKYRIEVKDTKIMINSITVNVRVWYQDLITKEMEYHDGVGACEIQTKKDTGHLKADMSNIRTGSVQMALPIAKTVAIKDACDHFGNLFGRNLNRKDTIEYKADIQFMTPEKTKQLYELAMEKGLSEKEYQEKVKYAGAKSPKLLDEDGYEMLKSMLEAM